VSPVDVVIVGGGPGGSVCAASLRRHGLSVTLLEKQAFPRFQLGESLLPHSLLVLDAIGALPAVEATFQIKHGARFHDDVHSPPRKERFGFDGAWTSSPDHSFQVSRDAFDHLLLDHARTLGVTVRERWTVSGALRDGPRVVGVEASGPDGQREKIPARCVVDASGRQALLSRDAGEARKIQGLDQTALYSHFEGVPRQEGKLAGDIDIVLFPAGSGDGTGFGTSWFWFIPFKDGRTSVGAVVPPSWIRERAPASRKELFDAAVLASPTATELLRGATRLWPDVEAAADFSYRVDTMRGDGWLAVGDAGGFIDPLFSTGVHLAMWSAHLGADAIACALASPEAETELLAAWEERVRAGAETFLQAVQSFYAGPLAEYVFAPDKHVALRRSITSLLAGDVFGDAVWLRDVRRRLRELA
jgi:flavin-dependent dehydrogenase